MDIVDIVDFVVKHFSSTFAFPVSMMKPAFYQLENINKGFIPLNLRVLRELRGSNSFFLRALRELRGSSSLFFASFRAEAARTTNPLTKTTRPVNKLAEVRSSLVGLPDFKSGVGR